jgi:hypothetical protein
MGSGLELELVWLDGEVCEYECRASSGDFRGFARFYGLGTVPESLAQRLEGFPRALGDRCELEFGEFRPGHDVGGFRLTLEKFQASGPVSTRVFLRNGHGERDSSVQLHLRVETSAIDTFVRELRSMEAREGARVRLLGSEGPVDR